MTDKAAEFKKANADENPPQMREVDGKKEYLHEESGEWLGKKAFNKKKTEEKKKKEAAEKLAAKAAAGGGQIKEKKKDEAKEDELDPSKYPEMRRRFLQGQRDEGKNPYPHKFERDMSIP